MGTRESGVNPLWQMFSYYPFQGGNPLGSHFCLLFVVSSKNVYNHIPSFLPVLWLCFLTVSVPERRSPPFFTLSHQDLCRIVYYTRKVVLYNIQEQLYCLIYRKFGCLQQMKSTFILLMLFIYVFFTA